MAVTLTECTTESETNKHAGKEKGTEEDGSAERNGDTTDNQTERQNKRITLHHSKVKTWCNTNAIREWTTSEASCFRHKTQVRNSHCVVVVVIQVQRQESICLEETAWETVFALRREYHQTNGQG